ncbi:MAG: alpha/beta fold hydrolase [Symploca sp. SIO2C1]|nr:alpha/beta fold hydrolase [Symploca sp. SIO2C1]
MTIPVPWQQRVGSQRDWVWRGWQTRYTYFRSPPKVHTKAVPVILLHGFGASIGHWRHNLAVLGQHHTIYALDLLGFGGSRKASADYKVSLWVEQVHEFWQTFIRQPVVLVGNSIGSLVCLAAAAEYPEMVKGFVMINVPDLQAREEMIPSWLQPVIFTIESLVASPVVLQSLFYLIRRPGFVRKWAGIAYANPEAITPELVEILTVPARDRGAASTFSTIVRRMSSAHFGPSARTILPKINVPMLLLWGLQDRMIPPKSARYLASLNPNLKLVELDNAGHCPHDECPEQVNQILLDWLISVQTL